MFGHPLTDFLDRVVVDHSGSSNHFCDTFGNPLLKRVWLKNKEVSMG